MPDGDNTNGRGGQGNGFTSEPIPFHDPRIRLELLKPRGAQEAGLRKKKPPLTLPPQNTIALAFFRDLAVKQAQKLWLIRNVIACGEVSSWIGKPGGGKSALLADVSVHGAHSPYWRGYRVPQPFGTVYFALERADLVKRRLAAYRLRDGLPDDLPIAVAGQIIDLLAPASVDAIVDAICRARDGFGGRDVGLAIIDTRAKGIAAGGGDEDRARDQNRAAANLRQVIERTGVHIASIGHLGKSPERGERGSNATQGDVDVEVTISGDTIRTADVTKANDQPLGRLTGYNLEPYEFAADPDNEDGQPYRAFIVGGSILDGAATAQGKQREPTSVREFRAAFGEALDAAGQSIVPRSGSPAVRAVDLRTVRVEYERRHATGETDLRKRADAQRKAFARALEKLAIEYSTCVQDDREWIWQSRR
jgi:hypothetical protein